MTTPHFIVGLSLGHLTAGRDVDVANLVRTARNAETAGLGFLVIDDSYGGPAGPTSLDPVAVTSFLGASTHTIGLIATVQPLYLEPFDVAEALATSDFDTHGRTGWLPARTAAATHATLFDRPVTTDPDEIAEEFAEFVDVTQRLFDGWEDGAVIRDVATGRYIDVDKLHRINHHGKYIRVRGPLVTPRSPQGRVPTFLRTDARTARTDATTADVLIVAEHDAAHVADLTGGSTPLVVELDAADLAAVAASASVWRTAGTVAGVVIKPGADVLEAVSTHPWGPVAEDGISLRARFGLDRPVNIYSRSA